MRVAIRAVEVLDQWPEERDAAIAHVIAERLAARAAEAYFVERASVVRERGGAGQAGLPTPAVADLLRALQRAARIAQERRDDLALEAGDETASRVVDGLQILIALLERQHVVAGTLAP